MMPLVMALALGMAGTLLLTPLARTTARQFGVVDSSDGKRKLQLHPTPLLGGVAVCLTLIVGTAYAFRAGAPELNTTALIPLPLALAISAAIVCTLGVCDDAWNLRVRYKLGGQLLATLPLVLTGHALSRIELAGQVFELGWWGIPFTIGWLAAGMNALNFLDGVDGLASTVGLSISGAVAAIAWHNGHEPTALLAMVLAGSLTGFLIYNLPPASIYLGDAGSMVIGLTTAILAIQGGSDTTGSLMVGVPLGLLSLPLLDISLAILRRTLRGEPVWMADRGHIHHRLLDRGLTAWGTLGLLGAICASTGAASYAACVAHHELVTFITVGALFLSLLQARLCGHYEYALARQLVLSRGLELAARFWEGRFTAGLPSATDLAAMPFDKAWSQFTEAAGRFSAVRLELSGGDDGTFGWRQDWSRTEPAKGEAELWTLEVNFDSGGSGWCKLRALVQHGPDSHPLHWLSLLDVLRRFGRHWSACPQQKPERHFRLVSEGSPEPRSDAA